MKNFLASGFRLLDFPVPRSRLFGRSFFFLAGGLFPIFLHAESSLILFREFSLDFPIPEASEFLDEQKIDYGDATIFDLKIALSLSGDSGQMFNGDWYAGIGYEVDGISSGYAVLLNRVGKTADWPFGYFDNGFDVIFDDHAPDIHLYRETTGEIGFNPLTGVWGPSGRETLPENVLDTDPRTAMLSSFDGQSGIGKLRLFLSHEAIGGSARLNRWSYEMNVVADPLGTLRLSTGDQVRTSGPVVNIESDVLIDGRVDFAAAGDLLISGSLIGEGMIDQTGAGKLILSEQADFSGIVSVTNGNLQVINTSGSATGDASVVVSERGILSGSGRIGGPVTIFGGGQIAPGFDSEIAQLNFDGDLSWGEGGFLVWKISDALGNPGIGSDWIDVAGDLLISSDAEDPFLIQLLSLDPLGQPGKISNFDGWAEYTWNLARAGSIIGFSPEKFVVDPSDFLAHNQTAEGTFSVIRDGREIAIHYAPIPEPSTYAFGAGAIVLLISAIRRNRLRKK